MFTQQGLSKAVRTAKRHDAESPYREFADLLDLHIESKPAHQNPHMHGGGEGMNHWSVRLWVGYNPGQGIAPKQHMDLFFSKGSGHCGVKPTISEVLEALASDSDALESDFEDWAEELGFDPDSREAERTHRICREQAKALQELIGGPAFEELRYNVLQWGEDYHTLEQAQNLFRENVLPGVVEQYGRDDEPAMSEAWNNWTDAMCKAGEITEWQYNNWPCFDL